ncbi:MAG: MerR family transcriptional regulator [Bacteroidia bacterium]
MAQYSIKDIERLTGIKAHTLRIWEQRYQIPVPRRTETNIRFYNDDDLRLLLNISLLNSHGHRISEIAGMDPAEISRVAVSYALQSDKQSVHIQSLISAMIDLDEIAFDRILSASIVQTGMERAMMEVVFPFLSAVGVLWQTGTVYPAYEHFSTLIIRQKLILAIDGQPPNKSRSAKKFMVFLPEGEWHEIGLLFANYLIRSAGHHSIYLGQNVPLRDVVKAAERYSPDYIFMSLTSSVPETMITEIFRIFSEKLPQSRLLVSGRAFSGHPLPPLAQLVMIPSDLKSVF